MTDASSAIELEGFEHVEAGPGTMLLRIVARDAGEVASGTSTLLVDDGRRSHRLPPLPAPPSPSGLLRVAYSAPVKLLKRRTVFALELSDGSVVQLPAPTPGRGRVSAPKRASQEAAVAGRRQTDSGAALQELRTEIERVRTDGDRNRQEMQELRDALRLTREEAEQERARAAALDQHLEASGVKAAELEAAIAIAEAQAAAHSERADSLVQELEERLLLAAANAEQAATGSAELAAEIAEQRARAAEVERELAEAVKAADLGDTSTAELTAEIARLREQAERRQARADTAAAELQAAFESVTAEADRHGDRATQLSERLLIAEAGGRLAWAGTAELIAEIARVRAESEQPRSDNAGGEAIRAAEARAAEAQSRGVELEAAALEAGQAAAAIQADHAQLMQRTQRLEHELEQQAEQVADQLGTLQSHASALAAQLEEAETRSSTLEQVVGAETSRREALERELLTARDEAPDLAAGEIARLQEMLRVSEARADQARKGAKPTVSEREALQRARAREKAQRRSTRAATRRSPQAPRGPQGKSRPADPPRSNKGDPPPPGGSGGPGSDREAALVRSPTSRVAPVRTPRSPPRTAGRAVTRRMPSEAAIGVFLLVLGLTVAVLILTGALKLSLAP